MPNINDAFPSKFLKASDLQGTEPVVTISDVRMEAVGQNKETKPVVYFRGRQKGLVLNKTNAARIVQITGSGVTEEWSGHAIKLYMTETEFQGERVECIRIRPKTASKNNPLRPNTLPRAEPEIDSEPPIIDDDEVPF